MSRVLCGCVASAEGGAKKQVLVEACTVETASERQHRAALRKQLAPLPAQPTFVSKQIDRQGRRLSLVASGSPEPATMHALIRPPLLFCCLAMPDFPDALARRLCEEKATEWGDDARSRPSTCSSSSSSAAAAAAAAADAPRPGLSARALQSLLERHGNPERVARLNQIADIQQSTEEVQSLVGDNLARLLSNADDLEALEDKSTTLLERSRELHRGAREVRRSACCKEYKLRLLIGLFCGGAVAAGAVLTLVLTHTKPF